MDKRMLEQNGLVRKYNMSSRTLQSLDSSSSSDCGARTSKPETPWVGAEQSKGRLEHGQFAGYRLPDAPAVL